MNFIKNIWNHPKTFGGGTADRGREHCRCVVAAGSFAGQSGNRNRGVAGKRAGHGAAGADGEGS